jgi:hypothetical protein
MAKQTKQEKAERLDRLTAVRFSQSEYDRLLAYCQKDDRKPAYVIRKAVFFFLDAQKA